jgi:hypothetical protein
MPFKSKAQQRFAYANPKKFGGKKGLEEWSSDTDFKRIPEKVKSYDDGGVVSPFGTENLEAEALAPPPRPRKKKFAFSPTARTRASYTKAERVA